MANFKRDPESPSHTPKKGVLAVERRRHPRFSIELPLDYCRVDEKDLYGGIVANAGEGGILVYLPERMEIGAALRIEIFYAMGFQLDTIKAIAKVVWSDLATRGNLGEHRYGLEFQYIEEKDFQKLLTLLKEPGDL
ncbi:MAG: PilZ domain-containing protein [Syntrophaceae bacterium]|nr:PilZ domain-containing protein [Syntrophaceae bacterium]